MIEGRSLQVRFYSLRTCTNGVKDNVIDLCTLKHEGMYVNYRANNITGIMVRFQMCSLGGFSTTSKVNHKLFAYSVI